MVAEGDTLAVIECEDDSNLRKVHIGVDMVL